MSAQLFAIVLTVVLALSSMLMTDTTYAASKPAQVKGLKVASKSSTTKTASVKLTWKKATRAKKYVVKYRLAGTKTWKSIKTTSKSATLKSLKGGKKYYAKVAGMNGKRTGKYSKTLSFTTKALQKPAPTLSISQTKATLFLGDTDAADKQYTLQLTATSSSKNLEWGTDDASVATVDQNGLVTPTGVGQTKISVCAENVCRVCNVTVVDAATSYNYINAKDVFESLATNNSDYVLIDVRQYSGENSGSRTSYDQGHIAGSMSAPFRNDSFRRISYEEALANLESAGVKADSGKKYVYVDYYNNGDASNAVSMSRSALGVSNDNLYILTGGYSAVYNGIADLGGAPYKDEMDQYIVKMGKLDDGTAVQMIRSYQMEAAFQSTNRVNIYTYLDVRPHGGREVCGTKVPYATIAPVTDNDGAALKAAVQNAGPSAIFVLVDDDGTDVVRKAYHAVISYGVPANRIIVQEGGNIGV